MEFSLEYEKIEKLRNYLEGEDYTEKMIQQTLRAVEQMEPDIRDKFFSYLDGEPVEMECAGVTAQELIDKAHMNLAEAFLNLDFLAKDPKSAKYILTRKHEHRTYGEDEMRALCEEIKNEIEDEKKKTAGKEGAHEKQ